MTLCTITGWQCHCQPPEIPCDGLKELREAYADWRRKAEQAQREIEAAKHDIERLTAACSAEATEVEQLRDLLTQAPIAKIIVREDGPADVLLYAPGLPVGEYDVYLMPEVPASGTPQIRQLCPECLGYMPCGLHPKAEPDKP